MTISNINIINQVNTRLDCYATLSPQSLCSLTTAADFIKKAAVHSVPTLSDLPSATENIGRMIYVESIESFRYSNGTQWTAQYISIPVIYNQVWTWGCNNNGQLGDNTTVSKSSPVSVVGGVTNWCQLSAGYSHAAAVRTNGTLWTWGANNYGQLGDNTIVNKSSPVSVVGRFTDWCQVSASSHTAAVRTNGSLWTWGNNSNGQLGDNTIVNKSSPVSVVGGFLDWCQVAAGRTHTAAVRTNGTMWTWGNNSFGQLGDNTYGAGTSKSSPVSVVGGFTDWCQVSASNHTAAVRTNGTLWTWGNNSSGHLGDNTIVSKSSPVSVVGGFTDWCQVSAGDNNTAAIRTNGSLWTWGRNDFGHLGDNTIVSKSSPVSVVGGFTDWCRVSVGRYHTAAVRTGGTLWTWGNNASGRLGDNTSVNKSSPVSVVGGFTDWCQVSAGVAHTAAIHMNQISGFNTP